MFGFSGMNHMYVYMVIKMYILSRHGGTHLYILALKRLRQDDPKFKAGLGNTVRLCLKNKEPLPPSCTRVRSHKAEMFSTQ
jgi:hypothetical protein